MPEGDVIARAARRLAPLVGAAVVVEAPSPRTRRLAGRLDGSSVVRFETRGKHLLVEFANGLILHSHLGMVGAWDVHPTGERWRRSPSRAWLVVRGAGIEAVQFDGSTLEVLTRAELGLHPRLTRLGPDVLADDFDPAQAARRIAIAAEREIADALLDQRLVAGLGTIWTSEALHAVAIDPARKVGAVPVGAIAEALGAARRAMTAAVVTGRLDVAVYGRAGRPCPRCSMPIVTSRHGDADRRIFRCPSCQRSE